MSLLAVTAAAFVPASAVAAEATPPAPTTPLEWSVRLAQSEMARRGDGFVHGGSNRRARWEYTMGLNAWAYQQLSLATGDNTYRDYAETYITSFITPEGGIRTYEVDEYNIDMLPPGRALLLRYERTGEPHFKKALDHLRSQLATHPRTSQGGFWHKQRYPYQMWLDGLYMGSPFYAYYGKLFGEEAAYDDVTRQFRLIDQHLYDAKTGLYYHGWDEKKVQAWANKETGLSPEFWGRAMGWYAMGVVDVLDYLPGVHHDTEAIQSTLRRVADGIVRYQDPRSGLWWQVMDKGGQEGNYLEASASSMFVYTLAKAVRKGYLPAEPYLTVARIGYAGLTRDLVKPDPADPSRINLTRNCEVAGLGYTNSKGMPRDGSYAYYLSEPIIDNDLKGVGPFILAGIELQALAAAAAGGTASTAAVDYSAGWAAYEAALARIRAPEFPAQDFPITAHGAKADGSDCTAAIAAAIAAANKAGGGRVLVPAGTWVTGAIHLKSGVNLHLAEGATLKFDPNPKKYPIVFTRWEGVECMNYSPLIYAYEQENIAITGRGTLDGGATWETWWAWNHKAAGPVKQKAARDRLITMGEKGVPVAERVFGEGGFLRPNFIQPYRCKNVLIEGVKIINSPMWEIHPVLSQNITVRGVTVISHGPNNDGCNPESSRDVLIEDCLFDTGDDCIAIKSGRNNDGRRVGVASENIIVRRCTMKEGHGGVVIGSEISGNVRGVFVEDCTMDSPNLDRALRFKSNAVRGGILEHVFMRRVQIGQVAEAVLTIDLLYEEGAKGDHPPTVRNIQLEQVTSSSSPRVMWIAGFPAATIENIRFTDCTFRGVEQTELVNHAGSISFRRVTIEPLKKSRGLNSVPPPTPAVAPGT